MPELLRGYGDPAPFINADGTISPRWELEILQVIVLPAPIQLAWMPPGLGDYPWITKIRCNRNVAAELLEVYQAIHGGGLWPRLGRFGGCYAWRRQRGAAHILSMHAWGLAVDHGSDVDPQGDMTIDTDSRVVQVFEARGWTWGGRFKGSRVDAMHHQYGRAL
jgi:hypothetical protein